VVSPAKKSEIARFRFSALCPVADVVGDQVARPAAARELAHPVPADQGPPEGQRDLPAPSAHVKHVSIRAISNSQARSVAREASTRIRRDVLAILELGLALRAGVRERLGVHVHHHLVHLAPFGRSQAHGQGHFSNEAQGIGPELA
jgi:hypothetical protein